MSLPRGVRDAAVATLGYAVLTLLMTWPLVRGLARDVPGDFGDPLLNAWILAWDSDHIVRALGGHVSALAGYWNANIFYPAPLTLAYSEHLTAQALQIFPVWAVTRNPVLCYNLVFLGTFVLSGLGMFLWARELTGRREVAFVAGLAFAFAPYRFGALPHLQVVSAAWMPFTLFGLRRFFDSRRTRALCGASVAWILQNLSCGYYLLYFSLFVVGYIAWELTTRRLWTSRSTLQPLAIAGAVMLLATIPFLLPYYSLRQLGFPPRSLEEVDRYSADVYGYLTADENLRLTGWLHTFSKAEGTLFPGFTVALLAIAATIVVWRGVSREAADATPDTWAPSGDGARMAGRRRLRRAGGDAARLDASRQPWPAVDEDHRLQSGAGGHRHRRRGVAGGIPIGETQRARLAPIARGDYVVADGVLNRDVVRTPHRFVGPHDRGEQPVQGVLSLGARLRWRARAGAVRDDCHAWPRDAGGLRPRRRGTVAARTAAGRRWPGCSSCWKASRCRCR